MGVVGRRQTWAPDCRGFDPEGLKSDCNVLALGLLPKAPTKLQKIVEGDDEGGRQQGFEAGDIVRLVRGTSGSEGTEERLLAQATRALVDFSGRQQEIIRSLRSENEALRGNHETRLSAQKAGKEVNALTQCTLRVCHGKLQALLLDSGINGSEARGEEILGCIHRLHGTVESALQLVEDALVRPGSAIDATCESEFPQAVDDDECLSAATAEKVELLPLERPGKGRPLLRPWRSFSKKVRKLAKACFRPNHVGDDKAEGNAAESRLRECRELLKEVKCWLLHWNSTQSAFHDGSEGAVRVGEPEAPEAQRALQTIQAMLKKSESYACDAVSKLLSNCDSLSSELGRHEVLERELLSKLDEMNLSILRSENKACAVAMELLMMTPQSNPL